MNMEVDVMSMSEQICNRRKDKKINQVDMAQMIGVKQSTISDYETGRATPTIDKLIRDNQGWTWTVRSDILDSGQSMLWMCIETLGRCGGQVHQRPFLVSEHL